MNQQKRIGKRHHLTGQQGVRGRDSDNGLLRKVLGWEQSIRLEQDLGLTYPWIASQVVPQATAEMADAA